MLTPDEVSDLPRIFRTVDYVRDWPFQEEEGDASVAVYGRKMVSILREADRDPVAAVAKRHGINAQTIYTWRKRFGSFQPDEVRRLKQLEGENAPLKKFRDECLSLEWFRSRAEAKVIIETWRQHYNEVRPHSSLGYLTPAEFVAKTTTASVQATGRNAAVLRPCRP